MMRKHAFCIGTSLLFLAVLVLFPALSSEALTYGTQELIDCSLLSVDAMSGVLMSTPRIYIPGFPDDYGAEWWWVPDPARIIFRLGSIWTNPTPYQWQPFGSYSSVFVGATPAMPSGVGFTTSCLAIPGSAEPYWGVWDLSVSDGAVEIALKRFGYWGLLDGCWEFTYVTYENGLPVKYYETWDLSPGADGSLRAESLDNGDVAQGMFIGSTLTFSLGSQMTYALGGSVTNFSGSLTSGSRLEGTFESATKNGKVAGSWSAVPVWCY